MGIQERKQREREHRRQAVIDAAIEVIMKKGFNSMTMDDIAEVAELSKATLYLYFKSKEELVIEIVIQVLKHFASYMEAGMKGYDPVAALCKMGESYLKYFYQFPVHYQILNYQDNSSDLDYSKFENSLQLVQANSHVWDVICAPIEAGKQKGLFRPDIDSLEYGVMLWTSGTGIINLVSHFQNANHHKLEYVKSMNDDNMNRMMLIDYEQMLFHQWDAILQYIKK